MNPWLCCTFCNNIHAQSPLALPAGMVEQSEGAALFRQLAESLSDHPAGKTLYRSVVNLDSDIDGNLRRNTAHV